MDISPTSLPEGPLGPSISRPRVALFCCEALRPAVCCVVDALEIRGFTVHLRCGRHAGEALQRSRRRRDADLRVVFASETLDEPVRRKLHQGLDPDQRGDVLLLPFDRPRDAIEAIEVATGRIPPRRAAPRRPTRAVLTHPTLIESKLELRRWLPPAFAGAATLAAIAAVLVVGGSLTRHRDPTAQRANAAPPAAATPTLAPPSAPRSDGITLAATRPVPTTWTREANEEADGDEDEDLIVIFDDEPAALSPSMPSASASTPEPRHATPLAGPPQADPAPPSPARTVSARPEGSLSLADPFADPFAL